VFRRYLPIILPLVVAGLAFALFVHYRNAPPVSVGLVIKNVSNGPKWLSGGSRILYHPSYDDPEMLYLYDIATRKHRALHLPKDIEVYSYSYDGQKIACTYFIDPNVGEDKIYVVDLESGKRVVAGKSARQIQKIFWLKDGRLLYDDNQKGPFGNIYLLERAGTRPRQLLSHSFRIVAVSCEGNVFLWQDDERTYHLFRLKSQTDTVVEHRLLSDDDKGFAVVYFSDQLLVLRWYTVRTKKEVVAVDLRRMSSRPLRLEDLMGDSVLRYIIRNGGGYGGVGIWQLSPDLTKCLVWDPGRRDMWWNSRPSWLYITDLPTQLSRDLSVTAGFK
jgi:hypothetical protein